jgi:hypothetical protein
MAHRRPLALALGLAAGSLLGIGLYARRGRSSERVDLYRADGSVTSLEGAEAAPLLVHARDALRAARQ